MHWTAICIGMVVGGVIGAIVNLMLFAWTSWRRNQPPADLMQAMYDDMDRYF